MPKKISKRKKHTSWRNLKIVKKIARIVQLTIFSFFALVISGLLIASVSVYKFIKTPFASSEVSPNEKVLSSEDPFTVSFIVLEDKADESSKIKNLLYLVVNPKDTKLRIFNVPVNLILDLPERFGEGNLDKVYALGELVEGKKGIYLTNKTLEKIFARKVDRHILTDEKGLQEISRYFDISDPKYIADILSLKNISKLPSGINTLRSNIETDLSFDELFRLVSLLTKINSDSVKMNNLSSDDLPPAYAVDEKTQNLFLIDKVLSEHKRVVVLNGSGVYRQGFFAARFIENIGGSVVSLSNTGEVYDKSLIIAQDLNSSTLKEIKKALGINTVVLTADYAKASDIDTVEADITIIVGIDYVNSL